MAFGPFSGNELKMYYHCNCDYRTRPNCKYCNEMICEHDEEAPTICIRCEVIYHAHCARKGSIRYIEKIGDDFCYRCVPAKICFGCDEEIEDDEILCDGCEFVKEPRIFRKSRRDTYVVVKK